MEDTDMVHSTRQFTFPYSRFLGFDHIWDEIERLSDIAGANEKGFPRHNVVKHGDDKFSIEIALAGYKEEDLEAEVNNGVLVVKGTPKTDERVYAHKGITAKKFVESFRIGEHVVVDGANFTDGLLVIDMKIEIPEEKRPLKIPLNSKET